MVVPKLNDIIDLYENFEFHKVDLSDHGMMRENDVLHLYLINENEKLNNLSPLEILKLVDLNYEFIFKIKNLNGDSFFEKLQDLIIKQKIVDNENDTFNLENRVQYSSHNLSPLKNIIKVSDAQLYHLLKNSAVKISIYNQAKKTMTNKEVIELNSAYFKYIKNPSEEDQILAVRSDARNLAFISNPSDKIITETLKKDGLRIHLIEDPSEFFCITAVSQNHLALNNIKEKYQTFNVCCEALKMNKKAFYLIKNMNIEICLFALDLYRDLWIDVKIVENPTYDKTIANLNLKKKIYELVSKKIN